MMQHTWRTQGTRLAMTFALCLVTAVVAPGPVLANGANTDVSKLSDLAEAGQFSTLLDRLQTDFAGLEHNQLQSLIADLERHREHEGVRVSERREAFEDAFARAKDAFAEGATEDALIAAIEAHGLADDADDYLARDEVREIVEHAERMARAAEEEGDWVEAMSVYRLLDLLYDDRATYRDPLRMARKHVRVLQVYAPDKLRAQHEARLERRRASREEADQDGDADELLEDEADQLPDLESESWEDRLKEVDASILQTTLHQASRRHVNSEGYVPLMIGAVDALLVLINTDDLADTFAALNDEQKRDQFRRDLERLSASLKEPNKKLNFLDVDSMIDRIMVMNDRSLELPRSVLIYEMTEGATQTLDEFSSVVWPEETERFSRSLHGRFYGVGIQLSRRDGRLVVVSPLANTPAQRAGVKAGDVIAQVDGRDASRWDLDRAVREISGPENTEVKLSLERAGEADLIELSIRRAEIIIESIRGWQHQADGSWDYLIDPDSRIGYLRLSQFIPQTADDMDAAIAQMEAEGPLNGLILDMRFNPGGLLNSAIDIADRFVSNGTIVSTVNADGRRTSESRARRHVTSISDSIPVVVLINQGSASASEIVAGVLQDYGRATIVGTRSFGKGSVQDPFRLNRGEAVLKLTTQYYQLPKGRIIDRQPDAKTWGIEPDLIVSMTDSQVSESLEFRQKVDVLRDEEVEVANGEEIPAVASEILARGLDPQLEAALLVLKTRLVSKDIAIAQKAQRN
ncbi:S41 family peptidase [Phycisphaerales bacterium AB-hyl4]|uniref:S41 family peptidase n=1 Tax=Natronomicrosphaera hydrolytica TaxID=3242702 RepID=A0ABV4U2L5_9BACT